MIWISVPSPLAVPSGTITAKDAEKNVTEMDASGYAGKRTLEAVRPTGSTNVPRGLEIIGNLREISWKKCRYKPAANTPPHISRGRHPRITCVLMCFFRALDDIGPILPFKLYHINIKDCYPPLCYPYRTKRQIAFANCDFKKKERY